MWNISEVLYFCLNSKSCECILKCENAEGTILKAKKQDQNQNKNVSI